MSSIKKMKERRLKPYSYLINKSYRVELSYRTSINVTNIMLHVMNMTYTTHGVNKPFVKIGT